MLSVPPEEAVVEGTKVEKAAGVTSATGLQLDYYNVLVPYCDR